MLLVAGLLGMAAVGSVVMIGTIGDDDDDPGREQRMPQTDLARALATRKLPNCAVVGCELVQHADTGVLELHNLSCWTPSDGARLQPPAPRRTSSRLSARFTTPAKVAPA